MAWYIVSILAGFAGGLIVGVLIDKDYVTKIAHLKIKGRGHVVSDNVVDLSPKELRKKNRTEKKAARKAKRSPVTNDL